MRLTWDHLKVFKEITKSWSRTIPWDLTRFQKSEVLRLFALTFWAFWRKNGANRTNIKEDGAICLLWSRILARLHILRSYFFSPWDSEDFGEKMERIRPILRKMELYAYRDLVCSRDLARFHKSEVLPFFPLRFWPFWWKNGANRTNIKEDGAICLSRSRILARSREIS